MSANPKTHTCHDCGYVWTHGQHGGHSCIGRLQIQRDELLEACINLENDDGAIDAISWNMIQAAVEKAGGTPKTIPLEVAREGYQLRLRMRETDALARELRDEIGKVLSCWDSAKGQTMTASEIVLRQAHHKAKHILP
jgi:hypothetical protein